MILIYNEKPELTRKHLDFAIKNKDAYGVSILEEEYKELVYCIEKGEFLNRYNKYQKCYEIYDNDMYIGDILFYTYENEISILIFDEYSNKGYAYRAIKKFVEENFLDIQCFQAVVMYENENIAVKRVLDKLGFYKDNITDKGNEIWVYLRK